MRKFKISLAEYAKKNNKPDILSEYDPSNPLSPTEIGSASTTEVRWICAHGHTEIESPFKRLRRGYCSVCGPKKQGSFAQKHPELLSFWSKDNTVKPDEIPPTYSKFIKWKCSNGHTWERRIALQLKLNSCPICSQKDGYLFTLKPELKVDWDEKSNPNISPDTVRAYSKTQYNWKCSNGHSYVASPEKLMRGSVRCPICASLGYTHPDAAKEWHPTKNGDKTPFDFLEKSHKEAWFICSQCGSEYSLRIAYRANRKTESCPNCKKKSGL